MGHCAPTARVAALPPGMAAKPSLVGAQAIDFSRRARDAAAALAVSAGPRQVESLTNRLGACLPVDLNGGRADPHIGFNVDYGVYHVS